METLNAYQRQQLIDYKNKLIDEAKYAYDLASIEGEKATELVLLKESNLKENIAKDINTIIYGA